MTSSQSAIDSILTSGWGPTEDAIPSFSGLPFAPFSKHDQISYIANFDTSAYNYQHRRQRAGRARFGDDENAGLAAFSDDENEKGFEDMITVKKKSYETIAKYRRDRTGQANQLNYSQGRNVIKEQKRLQDAPTSGRGTRRQRANKIRRKRIKENPRPMNPSVKKAEHWIDLSDIWFSDIFDTGSYGNAKAYTFKINGEDCEGAVPTPRSKKLILAGTLHGVLTKYDRRTGNAYKPEMLDSQRFSDFKFAHFGWKSACVDPYLLELAQKGTARVYTTDNVLSSIMGCVRSKYSFDIVINKIGNMIFLDERNKSLSAESVDETSTNRPTRKGTSKINGYVSLAHEATYINRVFAEQMVFHSKLEYTQKLRRAHPFEGELMAGAAKGKGRKGRKNVSTAAATKQCASQAFSYNLFQVTDSLSVCCRCGIDGYVVGSDAKRREWVRLFALNQYDSNKSRTQNWQKCLDTRDATVLAQEITNNNFKCVRWGIKAHLCDAKYLKLGFVTRNDIHSTDRHLIAGVKTYETRDFIKNKLHIRRTDEVWTILAKFLSKCLEQMKEDGRYIAVRDPLKQVIHVFRCRKDTFTKDDGMPSWDALRKSLNVKRADDE